MMVKRDNHLPGGFLLLILFILIVFYSGMKGEGSITGTDNEEEKVFIEVSGEVKEPGIYAFKRSVCLYDVLQRAGCAVTETSLVKDIDNSELRSGMKIEVYRKGGRIYIKQNEMSSHNKVTLNIPISLNNESMDGLTAIPGIGPFLSRSMIEERRKRGGFSDLQQLKELPGVGDKLYDKIIPYLRL
ncbi:helix-hairpin-helix domain-containing protein [Thermodesulfobacteriota bacterium]